MSIFSCSHKTNGCGSDVAYAHIKGRAVDGIGREHAFLYLKCDKCGEDYKVCNIHLPKREKEKQLERELATAKSLLEKEQMAHTGTEATMHDYEQQLAAANAKIAELQFSSNKWMQHYDELKADHIGKMKHIAELQGQVEYRNEEALNHRNARDYYIEKYEVHASMCRELQDRLNERNKQIAEKDIEINIGAEAVVVYIDELAEARKLIEAMKNCDNCSQHINVCNECCQFAKWMPPKIKETK